MLRAFRPIAPWILLVGVACGSPKSANDPSANDPSASDPTGTERSDDSSDELGNAAAGDRARSEADKDERLVEAYRSFSFERCADAPKSCPTQFARSVDATIDGDYNPRSTVRNPDPDFLIEWTKLPSGTKSSRYTWQALTLAAIQRTWLAQCEARYEEWAKATTARLAEFQSAIASTTKQTNPYDRLSELRALEPPKPKKDKIHEFAAGSDVLRWHWEVAQFDAFEETRRTFVYVFDGYVPSDELLRVLHPRQPREYERDAYCLEASRGNVEGVPALPDTSSWDAEVRGMVRLAVPEARAADLESRRADLARIAENRFAKAKLPNPQLPSGMKEHTLEGLKTFAREGRGAAITLLRTRAEDDVGPTGKPRRLEIDESISASFAEWPTGVELGSGDLVAFYGVEVTSKDTVIKSTPELEHLSRRVELEARHVTRVVARGRETRFYR